MLGASPCRGRFGMRLHPRGLAGEPARPVSWHRFSPRQPHPASFHPSHPAFPLTAFLCGAKLFSRCHPASPARRHGDLWLEIRSPLRAASPLSSQMAFFGAYFSALSHFFWFPIPAPLALPTRFVPVSACRWLMGLGCVTGTVEHPLSRGCKLPALRPFPPPKSASPPGMAFAWLASP